MTAPASKDSFGARGQLNVGDASYEVFRLSAVDGAARLPYSLKILLENLLRTEDGANITAEHVRALAEWDPQAEPSTEIQFTPARVIMQDFTGVPCVVDLATMREAVAELGGETSKVNPLAPAEMVIDHSVIIDVFGKPDAFERNVEFEYGRNKERYQFLRWGQGAFDEFKVVPPGTGIVHQVNIEHLARSIMSRNGQAYPDTCVGTDSHTTMVNGLGVLGWGVGGIEAEAAMLGQPVSMLIPKVVGFKLTGEIPPGATATDVVLTITEMLRKHGVVGKFVEFYGDGVASVPLANRRLQNTDDRAEFLDADLAFHELVAEASGNLFFGLVIRPINGFLREAYRTGPGYTGEAGHTVQEHVEIAAAIDSGDPSRARFAVENHLRRIARHSDRLLSGDPEVA